MTIPEPPEPARYIPARTPLKIASPLALARASVGILPFSVYHVSVWGCGIIGLRILRTNKAFEYLGCFFALFGEI